MPVDNPIGSSVVPFSDLPPPVSASPPIQTYDVNNPPWGVGAAFLVWVLSILVQFLTQIVLLAAYLIYAGWNPSSPDAARTLATLSMDKTSIFLQIFALFPAHVLTFAMVWMLVTRLGKYPFWSTIGWEFPNRTWTWLSVILGVVLFAFAMVLAKLVGAEKATFLEQVINSSTATRYTVAFLATFTAPIVEELVYRGVLFAALQRLAGSLLAAIVTLALFTVIHVPQYWPNLGVLAAVGSLSIALTIIRAKTGRLLPCVVVHFIFNGIQSGYLLIEPYLNHPAPVPDPTPSLFALIRLGLF